MTDLTIKPYIDIPQASGINTSPINSKVCSSAISLEKDDVLLLELYFLSLAIDINAETLTTMVVKGETNSVKTPTTNDIRDAKAKEIKSDMDWNSDGKVDGGEYFTSTYRYKFLFPKLADQFSPNFKRTFLSQVGKYNSSAETKEKIKQVNKLHQLKASLSSTNATGTDKKLLDLYLFALQIEVQADPLTTKVVEGKTSHLSSPPDTANITDWNGDGKVDAGEYFTSTYTYEKFFPALEKQFSSKLQKYFKKNIGTYNADKYDQKVAQLVKIRALLMQADGDLCPSLTVSKAVSLKRGQEKEITLDATNIKDSMEFVFYLNGKELSAAERNRLMPSFGLNKATGKVSFVVKTDDETKLGDYQIAVKAFDGKYLTDKQKVFTVQDNKVDLAWHERWNLQAQVQQSGDLTEGRDISFPNTWASLGFNKSVVDSPRVKLEFGAQAQGGVRYQNKPVNGSFDGQAFGHLGLTLVKDRFNLSVDGKAQYTYDQHRDAVLFYENRNDLSLSGKLTAEIKLGPVTFGSYGGFSHNFIFERSYQPAIDSDMSHYQGSQRFVDLGAFAKYYSQDTVEVAANGGFSVFGQTNLSQISTLNSQQSLSIFDNARYNAQLDIKGFLSENSGLGINLAFSQDSINSSNEMESYSRQLSASFEYGHKDYGIWNASFITPWAKGLNVAQQVYLGTIDYTFPYNGIKGFKLPSYLTLQNSYGATEAGEPIVAGSLLFTWPPRKPIADPNSQKKALGATP